MKRLFLSTLPGKPSWLGALVTFIAFGAFFSNAQVNQCETYHIVNTYPGDWKGALLSYDGREGKHPRASVEKNDPVAWRFEPVAGKANTYKIVNTHNDANNGASLSWDTESPHPMISVEFDDPVEWRLDAVPGKANTYKIVNTLPGTWCGASISYDGGGSHPMASLEFDDPVEWELRQVSNETGQGSPVGNIVSYNEVIGDVIIRSNGYHLSIFQGTSNGKHLTIIDGDPKWMNNGVFRIRYYSGKGYSIAPVSSEWQVLCTSRSNYTNNCDYLKPGYPLWLYVWMNGGNQFWNITKEGNSYLIQNTNSGLYMSYSSSKSCMIQTTLDKAYRFNISRYDNSPPPPTPPKVYECITVPEQDICLMALHEISAKTHEGAQSTYGNGLSVQRGGLTWKVANDSEAYGIAMALKDEGTPLLAGDYWLQNTLPSNATYLTWIEVNNEGTPNIRQQKIDPLINFPDTKRVLLFRSL